MVLGLFFGRFNDEVYVSGDRPSYGNDSYSDRSVRTTSRIPRNRVEAIDAAKQFCQQNGFQFEMGMLFHEVCHVISGYSAEHEDEQRLNGWGAAVTGDYSAWNAALRTFGKAHVLSLLEDGYAWGEQQVHQNPEILPLLRSL